MRFAPACIYGTVRDEGPLRSANLYGFVEFDGDRPVVTHYCSYEPWLLWVHAIGWDLEFAEGVSEETKDSWQGEECTDDYWDAGMVSLGEAQEFDTVDGAREAFQGNWVVPARAERPDAWRYR